MNQKTITALEKVFEAEIHGRLFQSKAKIYKQLEADGMVTFERQELGRDRFGAIAVEGWALTHRGRIAYCETCTEPPEI